MPTCRNFGVELLERRRQLCPTCWPVSRNAQAAMRYQAGLTQREAARATGEDPAQSPQAREKRKRTLAARQVDEAKWVAEGAPSTITREELMSSVLPRLEDIPLRRLQEATGLSAGGCSMIRGGKRTPHPRHLTALEELASSLLAR
jgi:hypothetical protein